MSELNINEDVNKFRCGSATAELDSANRSVPTTPPLPADLIRIPEATAAAAASAATAVAAALPLWYPLPADPSIRRYSRTIFTFNNSNNSNNSHNSNSSSSSSRNSSNLPDSRFRMRVIRRFIHTLPLLPFLWHRKSLPSRRPIRPLPSPTPNTS